MKSFSLELNIEEIAVLSDEEAAKASGGDTPIYNNGTLGCTGGGCKTSVTADGCTTEGCRPTSKGCTD